MVVFDDVIDGSETRRGLPCWYKRDDVKLTAINDGWMILNSIFIVMNENLIENNYYKEITNLFHEVIIQ